MRLGRVSLLSLGALVPLTSAYQAQQPLQVYLHPSPSDAASKAAPTLTADQAKAVLSHHLGESIGDFDEIPDDEGLWGHLLNMWGGEQKQIGGQKSRIVIIEGGVSPQEVLPSTLSQSPSFYMKEETTTRALLAPYLQRASSFLEDILASIPALTNKFKDAFDLAGSRAAQALGKELSCLTAFAESIPWIDHSKHAYPWEAITIAGLTHVDRDDEVWETGRQTVKAGLQAMTTPDSPPLLLIIVPSQSGNVKRQSWAELANPLDLLSEEYEEYFGDDQPVEVSQKDNRTTTAEACYPDQDTCSSSTTCSGRGSCILKTRNGDKECWGCKCVNGYAGQSCQKADYTVPFVILILTALLFLGLLGGSISLLYSVGETKLPSTLNLAVGGPSKRD